MTMKYLLNSELLRVIGRMSSLVSEHTQYFMNLSLGIATILILIVVAQESYKLMLGGKSFDLMFWVRPMMMTLRKITYSDKNGIC